MCIAPFRLQDLRSDNGRSTHLSIVRFNLWLYEVQMKRLLLNRGKKNLLTYMDEPNIL
jgi:hypothetical protein